MFVYKSVMLDFSGKGCPFSRKVMPNFRLIFLEDVPAGFISGFRVKFGAGLDSWYQSSRFHLLFSIHYRIYLSSHSVYRVMI